MRIIPTRATNGQWISPIPFMITVRDLDLLITDPGEREIVSAALGNRLGRVCQSEQLHFVAGHYSDRDSEERARISNMWFNRFNGTLNSLRRNYFQWVMGGQMKAGEQLEYDFGLKDWIIPEPDSVQEPANSGTATAETAVRESKEAGFRLLLSTRRLLGFLGVDYYDGPEFKFVSNRHPSPAESYVPTLAKEYLMQLIVPNALIALKHGKTFPVESAMAAMDHCMTSGKSPESVVYWQSVRSDQAHINPILEKYMFYVLGKTRDGREVKADHRCYFEKYVALKVKKANKFKKSRNQEVVDGLLKRMESEPELKSMSHRQLMAAGISNRPARMFMEARKKR